MHITYTRINESLNFSKSMFFFSNSIIGLRIENGLSLISMTKGCGLFHQLFYWRKTWLTGQKADSYSDNHEIIPTLRSLQENPRRSSRLNFRNGNQGDNFRLRTLFATEIVLYRIDSESFSQIAAVE